VKTAPTCRRRLLPRPMEADRHPRRDPNAARRTQGALWVFSIAFLLAGCANSQLGRSGGQETRWQEVTETIRHGVGQDPRRVEAYERAWQTVGKSNDMGWEVTCSILGSGDDCERMRALDMLYRIAMCSTNRSRQVEMVDILVLATNDPSLHVRRAAEMLLDLLRIGTLVMNPPSEFPEGGGLDGYKRFVAAHVKMRESEAKGWDPYGTWWKENCNTFDFRQAAAREQALRKAAEKK
jgi:hypothetical protein